MIYVTIIGHGPNWNTGRSVYQQDRTVIQADPGVVADVMNYELYELTAYFDRFSDHSATGDVADLARAANTLQHQFTADEPIRDEP